MFMWLLDLFFLNPLMCFSLTIYTHTHMRVCPITHISGICRITMNLLLFLSDYHVQCLPNNTNLVYAYSTLCTCRCVTLAWMPYFKHDKQAGIQHYVCVYVLTDCSCYWMPYYKYHNYKGSHHYVCVDVPSDCSDKWMLCYTHHKYKGAHHYACADVL